MTDRTKDEPQSSNPPPSRKPYRAPALIQWGTLQEITQTAGKTSPHGDGSSPSKSNKRTS